MTDDEMVELLHSSDFKKRDGFYLMVGATDEQFRSGDFDTIEKVFGKVDVSKMTVSAIMALLAYTLCADNEIPSRAIFCQKAKDYLTEIDPDRVESLMTQLIKFKEYKETQNIES